MIHVEPPEGYAAIRPLGKGGMGTVLLGRRLADGASVALKYLDLTTGDLRERFLREGRIACQLDHRNIVKGHAIEFVRDQPVLVFEYVDGVDVATMSELEGPMPAPRAIGLVRQLLAGLEHAHEAAVVHRDLKPANLIVTPDGTLKIADFGTARLREAHERMTRTGTVIGTPRYMAPEQAAGLHVDHRADVYAAGVVLFELLTRRLPIEAATPIELLGRLTHDTPARLESHRSDMPRWLSDALARCLAKRPEERFPSAAALAHVLAQAGQTSRKVQTQREVPVLEKRDASHATLDGAVQLSGGWQAESARVRALDATPVVPGAKAPWVLVGLGAALALAVLLAPARPRPEPAPPAPLKVRNALRGEFIDRDGDRLVLAFELEQPALLSATLRTSAWTVELERAGAAEPSARQAFVVPAHLAMKPFTVELARADGVPVRATPIEHGGLLSVLDARVRVLQGRETEWDDWVRETARVLAPEAVPTVEVIEKTFPPTPQSLDHARSVFRLLAKHARQRWRVLLAVAGPILDSPSVDLDRRRLAYEALLPLRILERAHVALGLDDPLLGAERALGVAFGTGLQPADASMGHLIARSRGAIGGLICPEANSFAEVRNMLVDSFNGVQKAHVQTYRTEDLDVALPARTGAGPRRARMDVQFNIQHGAPAAILEDELIWVRTNGWPLLVHRGCWSPNHGFARDTHWPQLAHHVDPALLVPHAHFTLQRDVLPAIVPPPKPPATRPLNRKTEATIVTKIYLRTHD